MTSQIFAQNEGTASRRVTVFKLVDRGDNLTPETGVVLAAAEIQVSKNAGAFVNAAGGVVEVGGGFYTYSYTVSELDTRGPLLLKIDDAAAAILVVQSEVKAAAQVYADLYDNAVWMQATASGGGTIAGVDATKDNPTSDISNALDVLGQLGYSEIRVYFDGTNALDFIDDASGLFVVGVAGFPLLAFDEAKGTVLDGVTIRCCLLEGDIGEIEFPLILEDCRTSNDVGYEGIVFAKDCQFSHDLFMGAAKFGQVLAARDCEFVKIEALDEPVDIDFQDNDVLLDLGSLRGRLRVLNNVTVAGGDQVVGMADGAEFTVDVSSDGNSVYRVGGQGDFKDETAAGVSVVRTAHIDEGSLGMYVLIDQREYVQDGPNQLQTKCRRSTFANEAARAAAEIVGAALVPPFVEGKHIDATKTQYVETTQGANPGEPPIHTVRTL